MKLDYFTLYFLMAGMELVVSAILIYYIATVRPSNRIIYFFLAYKIFDAVAILTFGLMHAGYQFIPLNLAVVLLYFGWLFLCISITSYRGVFYKKYNWALSISVALLCVIYVLTKGSMREHNTSLVSTILFATTAIHLVINRKPFRLPLLLAVCCILFAASNIARSISIYRSSVAYVMPEVSLLDTVHIIISFSLIIVSTVSFFLLMNEVDKSIIFEQNRLNKVALEQSPLSILITDFEGRITYVNPEFSRVTGFSKEDALGNRPSILKSGLTPSEVYQSVWETIKSGNTWFGEFVNKKKNGDFYYEEAAIAPLKNEKGEINSFFALKTDVTERKKSDMLILQQNRELKELNSTKNRLFSIISHDLRNPIGGTMSLLNLAEEYKNKGQVDQALELLGVAASSSKACFDLLENLLNWSRTQLEVVSVNKTNFDISTTLGEAIDLYKNLCELKRIKISLKTNGRTDVYADVEMIRTVVRNLVSNALKFTPIGGSIVIESIDNNSYLSVIVKDSGVGIDPDRLNKLFSFTENSSTYGTSGEKGTGLGLVLSNEFIRKNGGSLSVESELGVGTSFSFNLPLVVYA